jgi:hypothetical protein
VASPSAAPVRPDLMVIGAMKAATSSLHDQLALQDGIFMSDPKEPCYFSDDDVYGRGDTWYSSLFAGAAPDDLCGESSTHYTKLPRHPLTVDRIAAHGSTPTFLYMLRNPIDRLVSHYIHDWSFNVVPDTIEQAIVDNPDLVDFGRYGHQLRPYVERFGAERIHVVLFEQFRGDPQAVLDGIGTFLGVETPMIHRALDAANVSSARMRSSPWRDRLLDNRVAAAARRRFVPKAVRERVAGRWQMHDRPEMSPSLRAELEQRFDEDLADLADLVGIDLSCATFAATALESSGPRD